MNTSYPHCTEEQLLRFIDGDPSEGDLAVIRDHLAACARCRALHASLARFDRMLARMPLAPASPSMADHILRAIGVKPEDSATSRLLEYLAGLVGILIVMVFTIAGLAVTGVLKPAVHAEPGTPGGAILGTIGEGASQVSTTLGHQVREFVPFIFGGNSLWLTCTAVAIVLSFALLDAAVGKVVFGRRK